jgi:TPR repeat protein
MKGGAVMPKIIFTSRYMRDTSLEQLQNYVKYIGTREGVEKIDESKAQLPVTLNQQKLIGQLLHDIPSANDMLEYNDYCFRPTRENASEFISCALEQNLDLIGKRENYVDYIANRPRVERIGEHGLFTDVGMPVILSQVQDEVSNHKGPVWTHVISLRREDAARLGYDSGRQWRDLIRSKKAMLCKQMKIDSENLRWYCAFHNEGHHPHVHLMAFSAKDNDGFLTEPAIEAMRSELAHDIFRQDFAHIYEEQSQARNNVKHSAVDVMDELLLHISCGTCENKVIEENIQLLSQRLQNTGGKKVYGYLKADVKAIVDRIIDELAKDERVASLYTAWGGWQNEIQKTYSDNRPPLPPLSQQKQFKSIKNMVIAEAMKIGGHHFTLEDEDMTEPVIPQDTAPDSSELPDKDAEVKRLSVSADLGNQFAQYTLAKLHLAGKGIQKNSLKAIELFEKSAAQGNEFAQYQLGKLFLSGVDVPKDMDAAISWLTAAAEQGNQYAQYALGKLYFYDGDGFGDKEKSLYWLSHSTMQGNIYAQFLIDHINEHRNPSVLLAAIRLLHQLENLFREDYRKATEVSAFYIDRKRRRVLQEKKQVQGHARDDHEQQQHQRTL